MAQEVDTNYTGFFSLPIPIKRLNPTPNDSTSVWDTVENATAYASSATAYIGQLIYVQEDGKYYKVVEDGIEEFKSGSGSVDPLTKDEILAICKMETSEGEGGTYTELINVDELPTENINTRTIYVVPNGDGTYKEYIYVVDEIEGSGSWEAIGEEVPLSNGEIDSILN